MDTIGLEAFLKWFVVGDSHLRSRGSPSFFSQTLQSIIDSSGMALGQRRGIVKGTEGECVVWGWCMLRIYSYAVDVDTTTPTYVHGIV